MLWKEVKSWAKDKGYKVDRSKIISDTKDNEISYHYVWSSLTDETINGEATSVSKVATAIYNHISNNAFVEYQQKYIEDQAKQDIVHEKEGW
jgi:hypothetical protein